MLKITSVTRNIGQMAEIRTCERCGQVFSPRREHARFCSARCRVAWNRANMHDPAAEVSALEWSVTAMSEITGRLTGTSGLDRARFIGTVGEAVWLVTIVDATLVRHHPDAYDRVLAHQEAARRRRIENTLAGLRFVRNRIGIDVDLADLIRPAARQPAAGIDRLTKWVWVRAPEPELDTLSERGQAWELARYEAYQGQLAGHAVAPTFGRAADFLQLAARNATSRPGTLPWNARLAASDRPAD